MSTRSLSFFGRFLTPFRIAVIIALLLSWLRSQDSFFLRLTDIRAMDYRLIQRGPIEPGPETVIVAIDNQGIEAIGRWPWPRSVMAQLVKKLSDAGPAVTGFDILFSESSELPEPLGIPGRPGSIDDETWRVTQKALRYQDESLATALTRSKSVLGHFFNFDPMAENSLRPSQIGAYNALIGTSQDAGLRQIPRSSALRANISSIARAADGSGYFNVIPDSGDGFVRRVPLAIAYQSQVALPLSLAVLRARDNSTATLRVDRAGVEEVKIGNHSIATAEDGQMLINYRGPGETFPHVSAVDVLKGSVDPSIFRNKILLVGVTATAVVDVRITPFDEVFPGVEIHANVIDNVLRGDYLRQPRWLVLADIALITILALGLGLILSRFRGVSAAAIAIALLGIYMIGSQLFFESQGIPLSVVYPVLAIGLSYAAISIHHYLVEVRERQKMRKALDLYLSPSMAKLVSEQPERLQLGGEKRDMTVFFSDIRGFTSISEGLAPEELVELLNSYLGGMTDVIFNYDGMLDKYIGDAVMAVWGAPLPQPDHAQRACEAALEMVRKLEELNRSWRERGWPQLEIGVGLNTGPMVFGNMGSSQHLSLTVMGDDVNLGSRLEGLNKLYGTTMLLSEATLGATDGSLCTREIDLVQVKGKTQPVRIFELMATHRPTLEIEMFEEGISCFRRRQWSEAEGHFRGVLQASRNDGPAKLYLERCLDFAKQPPPDNWDGVTVMTTK